MDVGRSSTRHRAGIVTEQNVKGARFVIVSRGMWAAAAASGGGGAGGSEAPVR